MPLLAAGVIGLLIGLIVGFGTEMLMGREKARSLPFGSIIGGAFTGGATGIQMMETFSIMAVLAGGLCGLIGWLIYKALRPLQ